MVIVYPEGTRSTDGTVGRFASGAVRLAHDLEVPVVPVALLGTADVLPKNGSFHAVPVEVRFGAARTALPAEGVDETRAEAGRLRDVVVALREAGPVADPRSPLGSRWSATGLAVGPRRGVRVGLRRGGQLAAHRRVLPRAHRCHQPPPHGAGGARPVRGSVAGVVTTPR